MKPTAATAARIDAFFSAPLPGSGEDPLAKALTRQAALRGPKGATLAEDLGLSLAEALYLAEEAVQAAAVGVPPAHRYALALDAAFRGPGGAAAAAALGLSLDEPLQWAAWLIEATAPTE